MPSKKIQRANGDYADMLKTIRPFVSFDYSLNEKLTPGAKAKIRRYYNEVAPILINPNIHVYRPRRKDHLEAARELVPNIKRRGQYKALPIPTESSKGNKIIIDANGKAVQKTAHVINRLYKFNPRKLASDTQREVNRVLKGAKEKRFSIKAGTFEMRSMDRTRVKREVLNLVARYSVSDENPNRLQNPRDRRKGDLSHHYSRWLFGIIGHEFVNQADLDEYKINRKKKPRKKRKARK